MVKLTHPLEAEGEHFPVGSIGEVVKVLSIAPFCIVEFFHPWHCLVTVPEETLKASSQ